LIEEFLDFPYFIDIFKEIGEAGVAVGDYPWHWILEEFNHLRHY
jgi:hypothetical protein